MVLKTVTLLLWVRRAASRTAAEIICIGRVTCVWWVRVVRGSPGLCRLDSERLLGLMAAAA